MKGFPSAELEAERLLRGTIGYDPAKSVDIHVEEIAKALDIRIRTAPLPRGVDAQFCRPGPAITLLQYKPHASASSLTTGTSSPTSSGTMRCTRNRLGASRKGSSNTGTGTSVRI